MISLADGGEGVPFCESSNFPGENSHLTSERGGHNFHQHDFTVVGCLRTESLQLLYKLSISCDEIKHIGM